MKQIPESLLNTFRKYDTPTILNSLDILDSKFRTRGFTTEQMICVDTTLPPIVGYARTATISASSEVDPNTKRDRSLAYYEYVSSGTGPCISVIQDVDESLGFGAFWGEDNQTFIMHLGLLVWLPMARFGTLMSFQQDFRCWQEKLDQATLMCVLKKQAYR